MSRKKNNPETTTESGTTGDSETTTGKKRETKQEKFWRLAASRMNKVIESLRVLGHLANRAQYDYTEKEVDQMFGALNEAITDVNEKYKKGLKGPTGSEQESLFKFTEEPGKLS
jgi:hypothetical protein